jgi:tRNA U55 pseudouridine synthase TruB
VILGVQTDTGDPTGQKVREAAVPVLRREELLGVLAGFEGEREQVPPKYSAVKVQGKPLYAYARAGEQVEARARTITVFGMELLAMGEGFLRVRIRCSRGTYARVLAEQIGEALGTVAHLGELRREASGSFTAESALSMSRLASIVAGSPEWVRVLRPQRGEGRVDWRDREEVLTGLQPWILPGPSVLGHLPALTLSPIEARRFLQGGVAPEQVRGAEKPVLLMVGRDIIGVAAPGQRPVVLAREGGEGGPPPSAAPRRIATRGGGPRSAAAPGNLDDGEPRR